MSKVYRQHFDMLIVSSLPPSTEFKEGLLDHINKYVRKKGISHVASFTGPPFAKKLERLTAATLLLLQVMAEGEPQTVAQLFTKAAVTQTSLDTLRIALMRLRKKSLVDYKRGEEGTDGRLRYWFITEDGKQHVSCK